MSTLQAMVTLHEKSVDLKSQYDSFPGKQEDLYQIQDFAYSDRKHAACQTPVRNDNRNNWK